MEWFVPPEVHGKVSVSLPKDLQGVKSPFFHKLTTTGGNPKKATCSPGEYQRKPPHGASSNTEGAKGSRRVILSQTLRMWVVKGVTESDRPLYSQGIHQIMSCHELLEGPTT